MYSLSFPPEMGLLRINIYCDVKLFVLIRVNDETLANDVKVNFQQIDKKSLYILIHP